MGKDDRSHLRALIERIACLGRLPEHILWEAAKALALDRSSSPGRRFARLVESGAMLEAAILLVGQSEPSRAIVSMAIRGRNWLCVIEGPTTTGGRMTRAYQAAHVDPAAAVLMALISSLTDRRQARDVTNGSERNARREFQHHVF